MNNAANLYSSLQRYGEISAQNSDPVLSYVSDAGEEKGAIEEYLKAPNSWDKFQIDDLGGYVKDCFVRSRTAWQPEFIRMLLAHRALRNLPLNSASANDLWGVYVSSNIGQPISELVGGDGVGGGIGPGGVGDQSASPQQGSGDSLDGQADEIAWSIIPQMVNAVYAAIRDVFGSSLEAPFSCTATTYAQLPHEVAEWLANLLMQNIGLVYQATGGDKSKLPQAIDELEAVAREQLQERARDAADNLTNVIKERLVVANWGDEFEAFLYNFTAYQVAIMKGPFPVTKRTRQYDKATGKLIFKDDTVQVVKNISPFMFFPAPHAADCQSCPYVIELERLTSAELEGRGLVLGYRADAIRKAMRDYPNGALESFWTGWKQRPDYDIYSIDGREGGVVDSGFYDVLVFSGRVPERLLTEFGLKDIEPNTWPEMEIEVVGGHVIKAQINPNPDGQRKYRTTSFERVPGSIYGEGIASRLFDIQRGCEACIASINANMGLAAGPFAEVDVQRVSEDNTLNWAELGPMRVIAVEPSMAGNNRPAYTFHEIPIRTQELLEVLQTYTQRAYDAIGFSKIALGGNPETLGRTSSGMSIALNQAAKPLKGKITTIGRQVIVPTIRGYIDYELMTSSDLTIRGDVNVYPKGVEGIIDDESRGQMYLQAMQYLGPVAQAIQGGNPMAPVLLNLYEGWAKAVGVSTAGLANLNIQNAIAQSTGAAYQPQQAQIQTSGSPNSPAPPVPQMDGRQGMAPAAIQQANNIPGGMVR